MTISNEVLIVGGCHLDGQQSSKQLTTVWLWLWRELWNDGGCRQMGLESGKSSTTTKVGLVKTKEHSEQRDIHT